MKDYRKEVMSYSDAYKKEMISKIVVLRFEIKAIAIVNEKVNHVYANTDCCLSGFTLFSGTHDYIINELNEYYDKWVFLKGQIFYDDFNSQISFRPLKNVRFVLGS